MKKPEKKPKTCIPLELLKMFDNSTYQQTHTHIKVHTTIYSGIEQRANEIDCKLNPNNIKISVSHSQRNANTNNTM